MSPLLRMTREFSKHESDGARRRYNTARLRNRFAAFDCQTGRVDTWTVTITIEREWTCNDG